MKHTAPGAAPQGNPRLSRKLKKANAAELASMPYALWVRFDDAARAMYFRASAAAIDDAARRTAMLHLVSGPQIAGIPQEAQL
ncbi:hypothetical protein [Paracoccus sediminilitoris]|uniref:hypothetical protein n=1 Tax=Paracoccus sediminilitoris TaxID=2202419 RepID=UPI00272A0739|nr:hypothetical protein [Paracoccus sediminilitoris]